MSKTAPTLIKSTIVTDLYAIDAQIEDLQAQYAAKKKELMELGDGTYIEPNGPRKALVATPAAPKPGYTLYSDAAKKRFLEKRQEKKMTPALFKEFTTEQEEAARQLAGEEFSTLFDRSVIFMPAKGYEDLIPRLFKTATVTAKKLLLLCQVTKAAGGTYVKLQDKPKKEKDGAEDAED